MSFIDICLWSLFIGFGIEKENFQPPKFQYRYFDLIFYEFIFRLYEILVIKQHTLFDFSYINDKPNKEMNLSIINEIFENHVNRVTNSGWPI